MTPQVLMGLFSCSFDLQRGDLFVYFDGFCVAEAVGVAGFDEGGEEGVGF
jgi:hypothetical protein